MVLPRLTLLFAVSSSAVVVVVVVAVGGWKGEVRAGLGWAGMHRDCMQLQFEPFALEHFLATRTCCFGQAILRVGKAKGLKLMQGVSRIEC